MSDSTTTSSTTSYVLAKIGRHGHIRDLAENGTVYMQRLSAYLDLESKVVGDPDEGLYSRYSPENPTLKVVARIGNQEIPLHTASIKIHSSAREHGVYCMYGIKVPGDGTLHSDLLARIVNDRRFSEFGDTLLFFRDTAEFVRRLHVAAGNAGLELESAPIEYVSSSHCGEMGPFRKLDSYNYQSEWRFVTTTPVPTPSVILNLGCLLDIANWVSLDQPAGTAA